MVVWKGRGAGWFSGGGAPEPASDGLLGGCKFKLLLPSLQKKVGLKVVVGGELAVLGGDEAGKVTGSRLRLLLKLPQSPVVRLNLFSKLGVLDHGILLVELEAADPVEALEVEPASPPDANTVQDHRGFQVQLPDLPVEITLSVRRVEVGAGVEIHDDVEPRRHKCNFCRAVPRRIEKFILPLVDGSVSVAGVADLAFARVTFQELVGLKLLLLVGHHPRHLEQEPRLGGRLWLLGGRLRGVVVGGRVGEHVSRVRRLWVLGRVPEREHVERLGGCTVQHRGGLRHLHHSRY